LPPINCVLASPHAHPYALIRQDRLSTAPGKEGESMKARPNTFALIALLLLAPATLTREDRIAAVIRCSWLSGTKFIHPGPGTVGQSQ
jgi:hypothetical protein